MMPRYIDAEALKAKYEQMLPEIGDGYHKETLQDVLFEVEYAPTISPDEVRGVGKWIIRKTAFGKEYTVCSACLTEIKIRKTSGEIVHADTRNARYCMACGAKMEVTSDA